MEAITVLVSYLLFPIYAPNRILGLMLRDHSASGALAALREAEEQAAGAKK